MLHDHRGVTLVLYGEFLLLGSFRARPVAKAFVVFLSATALHVEGQVSLLLVENLDELLLVALVALIIGSD